MAFLSATLLASTLLAGCATTVTAEPAVQVPDSPDVSTTSSEVPRPEELSSEQRQDLLQASATDPAPANACQPVDLTLRLGTLDVALGHRFSQIVVRNVGAEPCAVRGTPGVGAVGNQGTPLVLDLEQRDSVDSSPPSPVLVEPGGEAYANLEWTGTLAGAESEYLQSFVIQFASGQTPVQFSPPGQGAGHPANHQVPEPYDWEPSGIRDLGYGTTVRIGPWRS